MTFGKPTKLHPREPGFYVFKGIRKVRDNMYEHGFNDVVELRPDSKGAMAVCMMGKGTKYQLVNFDGTWTRISLEDDGSEE